MSEKRFYDESYYYDESDDLRIIIRDRLSGMIAYDSETFRAEDLCDEFNSLNNEVLTAERYHGEILKSYKKSVKELEELEQFKENVFNLLDEKIKEYSFKEQNAKMNHDTNGENRNYIAAMTLHLLKKELEK